MNTQNHSLEPKKVPDGICSSSIMAAVLAGIVFAEIVGIGIYGYYRVQAALEPENLADRAEQAIRENYPEIRQELVAQVKKQSPQIAEQVSKEMISSAPDAREQLERFTARQLDAGLDEATELSAEKFRGLLRENHDQIVQLFEAIEKAPEETHELALETETNIEQQLGVDLQRQAKMALRAHRQLNEKLARLAEEDENLTSKELLERRIVRILRTMQLKYADEARVALVPPPDLRGEPLADYLVR